MLPDSRPVQPAIVRRARLATGIALGMLAACGGARASAPVDPASPQPGRAVPLGGVYVLEASGSPPSDTVVTFPAGQTRVVVMRHGPPENLVFAQLVFPATAFAADSGREVRVAIRPRPGVYGIDVETNLPLASGASVTFKYPRFFSAPAAALERYGGLASFERALAVWRTLPDGSITRLESSRPTSDNLAAPLPSAGTYLVAAPR